MEETLTTKKQTFCSTLPAALGIHRDSQTISKTKPKIRIIHIFAPEIIKTDVANFRELVQRLTGKPSENGCCSNKKKNNTNKNKRPRHITSTTPSSKEEQPKNASMADKLELMRNGYKGFDQPRAERVKEEEFMWNAENSGGFLERFADLEGFIQEFGEFPLLPNLDAPSSHLHGFEGTQLV